MVALTILITTRKMEGKMPTCRRGDMVEVDNEPMTPEEYVNRQGREDTRPVGYEEDLDLLEKCPEPSDPGDDFGL